MSLKVQNTKFSILCKTAFWKAKKAEQNYIIQFLKELKLYEKIDPDKVR